MDAFDDSAYDDSYAADQAASAISWGVGRVESIALISISERPMPHSSTRSAADAR